MNPLGWLQNVERGLTNGWGPYISFRRVIAVTSHENYIFDIKYINRFPVLRVSA